MPFELPSKIGLAITGVGRDTRSRSAGARTRTQLGVGTPAWRTSSFDRCLSSVSVQAWASGPV